MSETRTVVRGPGAIRSENGNAAATGAADFLYLAAAPTFATMALLTWVLGGGSADALCSIAGTSPLSGNGPDVPADECVPHCALAEADVQPRRGCTSVQILTPFPSLDRPAYTWTPETGAER